MLQVVKFVKRVNTNRITMSLLSVAFLGKRVHRERVRWMEIIRKTLNAQLVVLDYIRWEIFRVKLGGHAALALVE